MCSLPSRGRERGTTLDARPRARARRAGRSSPGTTRVHGARRTHGPDRRRWAACSLCTARSHQPSSPNCSLRTCASHARVAALPYCGQRALTFTHPPRSDCPPARCPPATDTRFPRTRHTARILTGKTGCPSSRANEERGVRRTAISTASDGGERGGSTHCRPRTGAVCTHVWPHVSAHFVFIFLRLHLPLLALRAHLMVLI